MAHTSSSINNLKSIIGKRGISKINRFEVDLTGLLDPKLGGIANQTEVRDLESLLISVSMPGRQLTTFGYDLFRHTIEMPTGYVNESLAMEFRMTADFFVKDIFDRWINKVVPKKEYLMAYADEYKCPITIKQLDNKDNVIYKVMLDECFPKAMRGIGYNAETEGFSTLGIEFAYNDLNFPTDPPDTAQLPTDGSAPTQLPENLS